MKKTAFFTYAVFCAVFVFIFSLSICASGDLYYDEIGPVPPNQEAFISHKLQKTYDSSGIKLMIAVVNTVGEKSPSDYASDYLSSSVGAQEGGILLLLAIDENMAMIETAGIADEIIPDLRADAIFTYVYSDYFSKSDFYNGFIRFISSTSAFVSNSETSPTSYGTISNDVYSNEYYGKDESSATSVYTYVLISLGVGLVAAIITVFVLKGQLKSVKSAKNASSYVKPNSFSLTEQRDIFLYSTVTKIAKPQNNSSSSRSSRKF